MIETFMAEAWAICSRGCSIALLALACCAAEADVLSDFTRSRESDASVDISVDAAGTGDAGLYPNVSDGSWENPYPPLYPDSGLIWTSCRPLADIFQRGQTGDSCQFGNQPGCSELLQGCAQRMAFCVNGVLHLGEVSKTSCEPDGPANTSRCASLPTDGCCVGLWQCDGGEFKPGTPMVQVCAHSCETETLVVETQAPVTGCPSEPNTPHWPRGWPPPLGMPCDGFFVCDSFGTSAGPNNVFRLDDQGMVYWCDQGIVQRVAIGNSWPWSVTTL
jgi:hypothetical protein